MRFLYTVLLTIATPLILLRLWLKGRELPEYRQRIAERFGYVAQPQVPPRIWLHAVSVGEALAAVPLIKALIAEHGPQSVWVTSTTPTGSARIQQALGTVVLHSYAPYDLPWVVHRFLKRVRPSQLVVMETELWPNLFAACHQRGISVTIANARLSPRSFKGYGRVAGFTRSVLRHVGLVAAQSTLDAERFLALGAARVEMMGNLKFDIAPDDDQVRRGKSLRKHLGGRDRPVWIAASTHPEEELAALLAHRLIKQWAPNALLILVPRHPQRFAEVAQIVRNFGMQCSLRSSFYQAGPLGVPTPDVFLGDSMGEMWMYLSAADVAFIAGSLVPIGGHNVLEPAVLGVPVVFGPHMHNFLAARELLLGADAAREVLTADLLAEAVQELLANAPLRSEIGARAQAAVAQNRGALQRLLSALAAPQ